MRGFFGVGDFFVVFAVHAVDEFDNDKDSESNNEEIDDVLQEVAISDVGNGIGAEEIRNVDREGGEIETTGEEAGNRHNHVVDEGFDDGSEGATDGDTNGEVDDATTVDELTKLLHERAFGDFFDWSGGWICHNVIIITQRWRFRRRGWSRFRAFA